MVRGLGIGSGCKGADYSCSEDGEMDVDARWAHLSSS